MPGMESTVPILETLTEAQLAAVTHVDGPLLILAGPGSGKTRVLTHWIAWLISEKGVPASAILAVTFTNKAAEEIASRLYETRGRGSEDVSRGTLHALCFKILRDFAIRCGLRPDHAVSGLPAHDEDDEPKEREEREREADPPEPERGDEGEDSEGGGESHASNSHDAASENPGCDGAVHGPIFSAGGEPV